MCQQPGLFERQQPVAGLGRNESGQGVSVGANPAKLSATYNSETTAVPEPASIALLGAGLFGLGLLRRRRRA